MVGEEILTVDLSKYAKKALPIILLNAKSS